MTEKEREKWSEIRSKGKHRFIFVNGLLYFGLLASISHFIFMRVFDYFFDPISFQNSLNDLCVKFINSLVIFSIGGIFWGLFFWSVQEKRFVKASELE